MLSSVSLSSNMDGGRPKAPKHRVKRRFGGGSILLLLLLLLPLQVLAMTRSEAFRELGLKSSASEKDIKKAYRRRSLETHPDKGGSSEEFVRVSEAYQVLTSSSGGGGYSDTMSDDEKFQRANDIFFEMFDEFLLAEDGGVVVDKLVDWLFGTEKSDSRETYFQKVVRWAAKKGVKFVKALAESDNVEMIINGQKFTGADVKRFREQAEKRAREKKQNVEGEQQQTKQRAKKQKASSEF